MRLGAAVLGLAWLGHASADAHAQAYLDDEPSLSAGVAYTYAPSGKILGEFDMIPATDMFIHIITPSVDYTTPVRGLAVEAELAIVGVKLGEGTFTHQPAPGEYDDGDFHMTPTDFKGGLRYQFKQIEEWLGFAVSLKASIPTHDYPTSGFVAPGHHLKALIPGAAIARTFDPFLPNLYFQGVYEYAWRERLDVDEATEDFPRNYSDYTAQLGYFLPWNLTIGAALQGHISHGGLNVDNPGFLPQSVFVHHDQLLDEDFIMAGGDLGYVVSDKLELGASFRLFVDGSNTRNANLYGIAATYRVF